MKRSLILALESSCDETAGALLEDGKEVLGQFVASQIDLHRQFGGVVPEVACRAHMECILPGVQKLLTDAGVVPDDISAIAVTNRPGMVGALLYRGYQRPRVWLMPGINLLSESIIFRGISRRQSLPSLIWTTHL